jgi:uncharacterized protein YacL
MTYGDAVNRPRLFIGMLILIIIAIVASIIVDEKPLERILNFIAIILTLCLLYLKSDMPVQRPPSVD